MTLQNINKFIKRNIFIIAIVAFGCFIVPLEINSNSQIICTKSVSYDTNNIHKCEDNDICRNEYWRIGIFAKFKCDGKLMCITKHTKIEGDICKINIMKEDVIANSENINNPNGTKIFFDTNFWCKKGIEEKCEKNNGLILILVILIILIIIACIITYAITKK